MLFCAADVRVWLFVLPLPVVFAVLQVQPAFAAPDGALLQVAPVRPVSPALSVLLRGAVFLLPLRVVLLRVARVPVLQQVVAALLQYAFVLPGVLLQGVFLQPVFPVLIALLQGAAAP